MDSMEKILQYFKQKKYKKCLDIVKSFKPADDIAQNLITENCMLICESLVKLENNDFIQITEIQEGLYQFFEKVTSLSTITSSVHFELKLTACFNFIFSLLLYNDNDLIVPEVEDYLELVNKALLLVVGRSVSSVSECSIYQKIYTNVTDLAQLISNQNHKSVLLILEFVIVVIAYIIKLNKEKIKECIKLVNVYKERFTLGVDSIASVEEFMEATPVCLPLFKFSLCKGGDVLTEITSGVIDCLFLLESTLLFLVEDFSGSLKSLQKHIPTSEKKTLWMYLVALNAFELQNWNLCSGFLTKLESKVLEKNLRARCHVMRGKLYCVERNHKEALREFQCALELSPNCPIVYYYIGQEYGNMGLIELMVENFGKLVKAFQFDDFEDDIQPNFDTTLLDWIHPVDEITELEGLYALAVSYGLNENFKNAAETFDKFLEILDNQVLEKKKRIIELPNLLTILHEASIMNLLLGNLVRSEQIALDATDRYTPLSSSKKLQNESTLLNKDVEWLEKVIQQELLELDLEPKELSPQVVYSEELIYFFPQNVIALLILSEIQRIQEVEDHKTTLSNVFTIFSRYLASMSKKETVDDDEKHRLTLVKALAGKTCDKIAAIQIKMEDGNVEKMFKRALSCNKGDRDAIYYYCRFLLNSGKRREAFKLWKTFSDEKMTVCVDSLQSFSLRYFLTDKVTKREFENLQQEMETNISFV